jgi:hypothetical protein
VTKDAGPASCAVVASQWAGGAVREKEVLFSVFFVTVQSICTVHCIESAALVFLFDCYGTVSCTLQCSESAALV